ncbi:MAG: MFS transporter [Alkalispirochaeta sp.]
MDTTRQHLKTPDGAIQGSPKLGLLGSTVGFFIGFAAVSLFGPTVAYLQNATALSAAAAGLLISIPNLTGSLLRIPFSAMVDGDGGRKPFLTLLGVSLVGVIGIAVIISQPAEELPGLFPWLLFFGALGGFGSATFSVGISQTSYWFGRDKQGSALGTYAGLGNLAPGIFAFLLSSVTIPRFGLPASYMIWAVLLAIGTGAYFVLGKNAPYFQLRKAGVPEDEARERAAAAGQELYPAGTMVQTLSRSAAIWQTWALVLIYFTTFGGFMALTGWFPKYWQGLYGLEIAVAGSMAALYSVLASLSRVAGGKVSDRLGGEKTAAYSLGALGIGALGMATVPTMGLAVVSMLIMAVSMGVANAAVFKLVPQAVPKAVGGAAGWVGGLGAFGGFVIPNLLAAFLSGGAVGYARGFWVFVGLAVVSLGAIAIIARSFHIRETAK